MSYSAEDYGPETGPNMQFDDVQPKWVGGMTTLQPWQVGVQIARAYEDFRHAASDLKRDLDREERSNATPWAIRAAIEHGQDALRALEALLPRVEGGAA